MSRTDHHHNHRPLGDSASTRASIDERCRQEERQARSEARGGLLAAARTANTLLRVAALHETDAGSEDHHLDEIEGPLPYRPRGSAAW
jgi:hypothetical protein